MKKLIKKIKALFENKKKRYFYLFLFILPFIVAMVIFGIVIFKEAKSLININNNPETNSKYIIGDKNYVLRDNATEYQQELFSELKDMLDGNVECTNQQIAESICKNYVADFYTWTNKFGQYDVGGLYYVYAPQKETIYLQARDEFYKFINKYINEYKSENLLEVNSIEASSTIPADKYTFVLSGTNEDGEEYWYDEEYETYNVKCTWAYVENAVFNSSVYTKKMNFVVINNNGRFEIVKTYE